MNDSIDDPFFSFSGKLIEPESASFCAPHQRCNTFDIYIFEVRKAFDQFPLSQFQ